MTDILIRSYTVQDQFMTAQL